MPETINIQINAKSILLLLGALAAVWLLVVFDKILLILFLAALLAIAIHPLVDRLEARHVSRGLAIVLIYLLLLGVLSVVVGLLVPVLIDEFTQLSASLPAVGQQVLTWPSTWLAPYLPALQGTFSLNDLAQRLSGEFGALAGNVGGLLVDLGRTLTTILVSTFLVLVVGFFLSSDARFTPRLIARLFPPRYRPTVAAVAREIGTRLGRWVRAQLLVGLFFGVAFGVGLALFGVPYALSLGVAGAVLELIPYLGGAVVTLVAMLIALTISPWLALGVLAVELVVATVESHLVYPKLVGDRVGIHPLVIIVALFIGAEAKGVLGVLLAVPVAIVLQVLFDQFYRFEAAEPEAETATHEPITATPQIAQPMTERHI